MTESNNDDRQAKKRLYQKALFAWYGALKTARLYDTNHPTFKEMAGVLVAALNDVFGVSIEFSVQQSDGVIRIDDEIFVEESLTMFELLALLEQASLARVLFLPGIEQEEIERLLTFLKNIKGRVGVDTPAFGSNHIRTFPEQPKIAQATHKQRTLQRIQDTLALLETWTQRTEALHTRLLEEQHLSVSDLADPLDELIDSLHRNPSLFSIGFALSNRDPWSARHAVRCLILSTYIGQQIGFDPSVLKMLGIAALCHDIGRNFLPNDTTTGENLASGDLDFIRLHARDGASFLAGVQGLPLSVIRVALEHHVAYDGSGYPSLPAGVKPHVLSQIVGLADFVSWQTLSESSYRRPVPLYKIARAMLRRSGTQFHPILVKLALPFLGLYPVGTRVRLSNGSPAISLEPNTRNLHRPAVALNFQTSPAYNWLSQVGDKGFLLSAVSTHGEERDLEKMLPLIPTLFQTNT